MPTLLRPRPGSRRLTPLLAGLTLGPLAATALAFGPTASAAPTEAPSLQVFSSEAKVQLHRHRREPVWAELFPKERARLLALLLERVEYDADQGEVALRFRAGGPAR